MADSDQVTISLAEAANDLSRSAVVLSAVALFIALLQAVHQYISASEVRFKCNQAAIGGSSKAVKRRWSLMSWKRKFYYPDLNFARVDFAIKKSWEDDPGRKFKLDEVKGKPVDTRFVKKESMHISDVSYGFFVVRYFDDNKEGGIVKSSELQWQDRLRFWIWRFRHRSYTLERPRATWAQMLLAFGIRDTKCMAFAHVDADTIPSYLDVPIQRIRLKSLGQIAFMLGFKTVSIHLLNRSFTAIGDHGTIKTEDVPNFGKVIRFEGDIITIHQSVAGVRQTWVIPIQHFAFGCLNFGRYRSLSYFLSLDCLYNAIAEKWTTNEFQGVCENQFTEMDNETNSSGGHLPGEARYFKHIMSILMDDDPEKRHNISFDTFGNQEDNEDYEKTLENYRALEVGSEKQNARINDAIALWQDQTKHRAPTIFFAATFADLSMMQVPFPSSLLLHPFLPLFQQEARSLVSTLTTQHTEPGKELQNAVANSHIDWLWEAQQFCMGHITGLGLDGLFSWGTFDMISALRKLEEKVFEALILCKGCRRKASRDDGYKYKNLKEEKPAEHQVETPEFRIPIMPHTRQLLEDFRPIQWADRLRDRTRFLPHHEYNIENLLWAQLVVLDLVIRLIIRGGHTNQLEEEASTSNKDESKEHSGGFCGLKAKFRGLKNGDLEKQDQKPGRTNSDGKMQENDLDNTKSKNGGNRSKKEDPDTTDENPGKARWADPEKKVVEAIIKSWQLTAEEIKSAEAKKLASWDLASDLKEKSGIEFKECLGVDDRFQQLANLLKIRALFYIALLMIAPDSTELYLAQSSTLELPIV